MASGITHARVATTAAVALTATAAALYVAGAGGAQAAGIVAGAVAGWLITPDADMVQRTHEESRIYRCVGPVAGFLWQMYWMPYAKAFSHRGRSHALILGTLTRFVYVLLPAVALLIALTLTGTAVALPAWAWPFAWWTFAAWAVQDALHLIWDL